jgi:riboflavin kinase / FMN adenylyltransferase
VQRWFDLASVPADLGPSVVTVGNFDGVHRGHQALLTRLVTRARDLGVPAVVVTFDPHPVAVLRPERAPRALTTLEHRLHLVAAAGVDGVLVMEFTPELATWSPERFVEEVLVRSVHARAVVVGQDTRFGHRNSGDVGVLVREGKRYGFAVEVVEDLGTGNGAGRRWSSSWVRELVVAGEVAEAARVLTRPHRVTGVVVHGDHRGRTLGFPTANLDRQAVGLVPADGVYAGRLVRDADAVGRGDRTEKLLPAAISVGTNPTFEGESRRVEAHVLDRDDLDLYGELVAVEFVARLRPMLRLTGVEDLVTRMRADVEQCRAALGLGLPETCCE